MEADRLRPGRLPEHVVLEDPDSRVTRELRRQAAGPFRQHLSGNDGVGLPRVAKLACAVLGVTAGDPVHLVGPDPGLVLALEQLDVPLAQQLEPTLGDEPLLDDQETVALEGVYLLGCERVDQERGRVLSGS